MARPDWTDQDTEDLRQLHADGQSATACAKIMGRSASTITRRAKGLGLSFLPSKQTANAIAVTRVKGLEGRVELSNRLQKLAHELIDMAYQPWLAYNFGGKDNTYEERQFDRPDLAALGQIIRSTKDLTTTIKQIEDMNQGATDMSDIDLFLAKLTGDLDDGDTQQSADTELAAATGDTG